jgi:hypothetical protein
MVQNQNNDPPDSYLNINKLIKNKGYLSARNNQNGILSR